MLRPSDVVDVGKRIASDVSEKNVTFMAAGIAYNAFVSLAPLLILLLFVVTVVGGGLEERIVSLAERSLPGPIAGVVTGIFAEGSAAAGASVVGLVVLVWGTLKVFRGLDTAFSEIYETDRQNSFVDQLVDGVVVGVALLVGILATVAASSVFAAFADAVPSLGLLTPLVLVAGLVLAFLPMYYRFPDADLGWRDVLPGAVFAALGWAALQAVFQVYLVFSGGGSGSFFGGVIVVVTWLYFSGLVLLLGAVINAVVGDHSSGAPGGVGRGAAGGPAGGEGTGRVEVAGEVEERQSLSGEELASYLRDLRGRLTGHYEEVELASEPVEPERRTAADASVSELVGTVRKVRPDSAPVDGVEVVERSGGEGHDGERTVTIRWRPAGEDADG